MRNPLPLILHQADLMAAYIEFQREYKGEFDGVDKPEENFKLSTSNKGNVKNKALGNVGSEGLLGVLDNL